MDNKEIQEYHRHRYPYILIDTIESIEPGKSARGYKYFSENEWLVSLQQQREPACTVYNADRGAYGGILNACTDAG